MLNTNIQMFLKGIVNIGYNVEAQTEYIFHTLKGIVNRV